MNFKMTHRYMTWAPTEHFTEDTAPDWLTSANTIKGSTADGRWFWNEQVLKLEVGQTIGTDFRIIERLGDDYGTV